ncbi:SGNH/GDSL hydrolase family protein [Maritimibacter dapengensis]|uniref:SGNH/GDSL hydrolase family protein n=1 Tax=Maritimibacter dapengensis TaxID=2836868 RepID=A0ABS6T3Q0_9RHOB|nr:SGNH/GDSL hydrolase family protein [Maritimibacter dapengensis]MBV7379820.1 SGNH/GDSL hydrolase family protein [Maritimibacter dapengensis]
MGVRIFASIAFLAGLMLAPGESAADSMTVQRTLEDSTRKPGLKIVVSGTSLSAGYSWPKVVERRLGEHLDREVRVESISRPGATSEWGVEQVGTIIRSRPDILILEFSINDSDLRQWISLSGSRANHLHIIEEVRRELPATQVVLASMSPAYGLRRLIRPRLHRYYGLYEDLADKTGASFLDLGAAWTEVDEVRTHFPDGLHPKDSIATEVIVPVLVDYVRSNAEVSHEP